LKWMNEELAMLNAELEEKVSQRTKALEISNQELSVTNLRLVETEQSRRNLLANVAHELGTPVTLIHGYVQSLQEGTITSDDEYFRNLVDDKIKVLDRLITDLSDLSRLEEGQASFNFATYDLFKWLEKVYQKLVFDVETLGRKISLQEIPFTENMYESSLDTERMDQVFVNIISNAVKITSAESGQIDVKVDINEKEEVVNIAISDNGKGIDQAMMPHIFDRFYKEKYRTISNSGEGGTGLGLAIVKEIIQGHHGDIWVESEEGVGSTFYISLPVKTVYKKVTQLVH